MEYANLQPGQNVLDLGTGTGLVAIEAKKKVGAKGTVYGIDFTPEMLSEARHKARRARLPIKFIQHDINDLDQLIQQIPIKFDVSTCASAFYFIENAVDALKRWSEFLKPGGRIIFDITDEKYDLAAYAMYRAAQRLNLPTFPSRNGSVPPATSTI
jgi:ubiquinone/menaquinone biosynthesis C-methylase UbiE